MRYIYLANFSTLELGAKSFSVCQQTTIINVKKISRNRDRDSRFPDTHISSIAFFKKSKLSALSEEFEERFTELQFRILFTVIVDIRKTANR